jgi:hypothetical protein
MLPASYWFSGPALSGFPHQYAGAMQLPIDSEDETEMFCPNDILLKDLNME